MGLLEIRNYFTSKTCGLPVRNDGLQPGANLDAIFVIADGKQDEHTTIIRLRSNAPLPEQASGKALNGRTLEALHSNHGNLSLGATVNLAAEKLNLPG